MSVNDEGYTDNQSKECTGEIHTAIFLVSEASPIELRLC